MQARSLGQEDPLEKENGNLLQYFCLENPMEGGAWWDTVHGVEKSGTQLSDFTFTFALSRPCAKHSEVVICFDPCGNLVT